MNFGHSWEISREILAEPEPGRAAKIISGRGFPGHRISKKLIARVRPGVELVRASFVPTSELITLDLPTFDRPRKAISGRVGEGKCPASLADNRNRERTRTLQSGGFTEKLQAGEDQLTTETQGHREKLGYIRPGSVSGLGFYVCSRSDSSSSSVKY